MHACGRNKNTDELVERIPDLLNSFFARNRKIAIAFSGGLDSRFLAHVANICCCDLELVHIRGSHISAVESDRAIEWAKSRAFRHVILELDPFTIPEVARGDRSRCYFCKKALFSRILEIIKKKGDEGRILCDGTNYDDLSVFRPGIKAIQELEITSPLALANLSKAQIRSLAKDLNLDNPSQKARPCLLTRYAYNLKPDRNQLLTLAAAEEEIENLLMQNNLSGVDFRLRLLPDPVLHLEEAGAPILQQAMEIIKNHGFANCKAEIVVKASGFFDKK